VIFIIREIPFPGKAFPEKKKTWSSDLRGSRRHERGEKDVRIWERLRREKIIHDAVVRLRVTSKDNLEREGTGMLRPREIEAYPKT